MPIAQHSLTPLEANVLAVLTRHDPEGLTRSGAPCDEYDPEARDLAFRLATGHRINEATLIEVWTAWFGDTAHLASDPSAVHPRPHR